MWEDERNSAGGRWLLQLPPTKKYPQIDDYWKDIVRIKFYLYFSNTLKFKNVF